MDTECSRVDLPAANTIQTANAMGACRRNLLTCSRHLETYLLFDFCGIRTPDSLKIVLQILNDKKHTRKLQKIDRRPDQQLNLRTILYALHLGKTLRLTVHLARCQVESP